MHQQLKDELGLDHFEGRSWRGLHHHALLCLLALAFLQHLRARGEEAGGTAPEPGPPPAPSLPAIRRADRGGAHPRAAALPALPGALRDHLRL